MRIILETWRYIDSKDCDGQTLCFTEYAQIITLFCFVQILYRYHVIYGHAPSNSGGWVLKQGYSVGFKQLPPELPLSRSNAISNGVDNLLTCIVASESYLTPVVLLSGCTLYCPRRRRLSENKNRMYNEYMYIDCLVQGCDNPSTIAMELRESCAKASIYYCKHSISVWCFKLHNNDTVFLWVFFAFCFKQNTDFKSWPT